MEFQLENYKLCDLWLALGFVLSFSEAIPEPADVSNTKG